MKPMDIAPIRSETAINTKAQSRNKSKDPNGKFIRATTVI